MAQKSPSPRNAKAPEKVAGASTPDVVKATPMPFTAPTSTPVRTSVNAWWCPVDGTSYQKEDSCQRNPACGSDGCWSK
jgi:hypothetical protein